MAQKPYVLLCTVGSSLKGNLKRWREQEMGDGKDIAHYTAADWDAAVAYISGLKPEDRACGAEINSIQALINEGHVVPKPEIHLFHSDTDDGRHIARLLERVYAQRGFHGGRIQLHAIEGLRDDNPRKFRTTGLRNLVRELCRYIQDHYKPGYGAPACAINATGGYKAQIAIAVMIGQALGVSVYYKHELFARNAIISFPPLPIALDESVWHDNVSLFHELYEEPVCATKYEDELDEVLESLLERETQEGKEYLCLSSAGYILHEKCKSRAVDDVRPLHDVRQKRLPHLGQGHMADKQNEIRAYMQRVIDGNAFVATCRLFYTNKDLPRKNHFRLAQGKVVGVYSDGTFTAKFEVVTTAEEENQKRLAVDRLNQWLTDNT